MFNGRSTKMNTKIGYRIVVGVGNEIGHITDTRCRSIEGARRRARQLLAPYRGDGWAVICDIIESAGDRQYPRVERM